MKPVATPAFNQPMNHAEICAKPPQNWCGKIPLIDLPSSKGQDVVGGVGKTFITSLCASVASVLNKGIPAKAEWVTKGPASDSHAIATAAKIHIHTINYINAINSLPNDPPPNTLNPATGDLEDVGKSLTDEEKPANVDANILLNSVLWMDYVASAEEPNLDDGK